MPIVIRDQSDTPIATEITGRQPTNNKTIQIDGSYFTIQIRRDGELGWTHVYGSGFEKQWRRLWMNKLHLGY